MPERNNQGDLTETEAEKAQRERSQRTTILECPQCQSHRAIILETRPPKARCADCDATYKIKTAKPLGSLAYEEEAPTTKQRRGFRGVVVSTADPIKPRDIGILTDFINDALTRGPEGVRQAERHAEAFARKFHLSHFDPHWLAVTPWLQQWANGDFGTRTNGAPATPRQGTENSGGQSDSRVRVRTAVRWRAAWLCNYAMTASKAAASRAAHVTERTANYHLNSDADFNAQAVEAKDHAIDLLHTRMFQRALEGDLEPVFWQGIEVGHVKRFDSRLQIEMARAHMPDKFKTPGQALINIDSGDKILVMDEATRMKLVDRRREKLIAAKAARELTNGEGSP